MPSACSVHHHTIRIKLTQYRQTCLSTSFHFTQRASILSHTIPTGTVDHGSGQNSNTSFIQVRAMNLSSGAKKIWTRCCRHLCVSKRCCGIQGAYRRGVRFSITQGTGTPGYDVSYLTCIACRPSYIDHDSRFLKNAGQQQDNTL